AGLWKKLISNDPENHLAFKANAFLENFTLEKFNQDHLPKQMSLFGISALPKVFLQVFEKVSEKIDIHLFLLAPSNQFFFDIQSEKQIGKIALQETGQDTALLHYEMTNPLLSSLGTSGKNFYSSLELFNYHEPFEDLFEDPLTTIKKKGKASSMLTCLQSDILNLVHRKKGTDNPAVNIEDCDTSISIHACHSPMREVQVLKDLLLNEFEKDPELAPHDIIVMMPDIESYAPFIESVFSLEDSLPFSISDRRKRSESEALEAFLKILELKNSRWEKSQVLDLLLSESIANTFNISFDDISKIEKMVQDAN
ncbi:MAG: exodeoxyribonuclease V subunit gamma, partial [Desulfobacteraceae bacterium]|nr:exodeoxyribonuclease V subunit gamma [Desulfobacteraceae bacterium]